MTNGFALLNNLLVRLVIFISAGAAGIKKELSQFQVFFIAGGPVESGQSHLNYLVTGCGFIPARTEYRIQKVGILNCNVQQATFAGGLVMRHRRLIKMAHVIQFVTATKI